MKILQKSFLLKMDFSNYLIAI